MRGIAGVADAEGSFTTVRFTGFVTGDVRLPSAGRGGVSFAGGVGGRFEDCEREGEFGSGMPTGVGDRELVAIGGCLGD